MLTTERRKKKNQKLRGTSRPPTCCDCCDPPPPKPPLTVPAVLLLLLLPPPPSPPSTTPSFSAALTSVRVMRPVLAMLDDSDRTSTRAHPFGFSWGGGQRQDREIEGGGADDDEA